jgi:spermidine/putrescine transport system ATP-binding protein
MQPEKTLRLDNISKVFTDSKGPGVHGLSLEVREGEGFSLLGPSGCGKTTTLRMIGGFEKPDQGRIFFEGQDITPLPPQDRDIRTVFQKYALFPHLSVWENVIFGLRTQRLGQSETKKRGKMILELMEISHLQTRRVPQLSGGEQQRVALARALITEPSILLLDEPLSALDQKLREKMQLELLTLRKKLRMTFVFVTHDQGEAMVLSDRLGVMNKGRLEQVGTPEEIYCRPTTRFVASFIGQANFIGANHIPLLKGEIEKLPTLKEGAEWMLRPENCGIRKKSTRLAAGHVGLTGRVAEMAYLGQHRIAKVYDPRGHSFLVKAPGGEASQIHEGEEVFLVWKVEDLWSVDTGPLSAGKTDGID